MQYTKTCMRNQFLFCEKDAFQNKDFSRLNCQLKRKKLTEQVGKDFPSFSRRGNGLSKLVEFSTQNLFQIRACVISAQKARHFEVTNAFTYSHANTPLGLARFCDTRISSIFCNLKVKLLG